MTNKYDYLFKLLIIGESGVGKTCLLLQFTEGSFTTNHLTTIGIDFKIKIINLEEKQIKLQIWDTAGQERFKTITSAYYRGADCVLICYDVSDRESFNHVPDWMDEVAKLNKDDPLILILGNKCDMENKAILESDRKVRKF